MEAGSNTLKTNYLFSKFLLYFLLSRIESAFHQNIHTCPLLLSNLIYTTMTIQIEHITYETSRSFSFYLSSSFFLSKKTDRKEPRAWNKNWKRSMWNNALWLMKMLKSTYLECLKVIKISLRMFELDCDKYDHRSMVWQTNLRRFIPINHVL